MCLVTQDGAILSREKLTLGELASVFVGHFSAESQARAQGRFAEAGKGNLHDHLVPVGN